ncbi:MAG TPA: hypothetical protein VMR75_03865 [Candidatus Saccharimonadales bacterium]|nr:hypothetical protein [Candidatus Saccharimonadales bacterium]
MMNCQHCGSSDLVVIQGQNYCLNCGYAVNPVDMPIAATADLPDAPPPTSPALLSEKPAKLPKRRVAKAKGSKRPKTTAKAAAKRGRAAVVASSSNVGQAPEPSAAALAAGRAQPGAPKALGLHRRMPASIPARRAHPLRFSLSVAAILGVLVGGLVSLSLWLQFDSDIVIYLVLAGVVTVAVMSMLAQSALMYGIARIQDGRPAPHLYWWAAARSGFMDVLNLNVSVLIGLAVIVVAGVASWHFSTTTTAYSPLVRLVMFAIINLVLAWAFLGMYVTRRVALPAIIVGGVTASEGFKVGWRLYWRSGGHLLITGLEAALGRLLAVIVLATGVYALAYRVASPTQTEVVIGTGVAVALGVLLLTMVLLEWEARIWLRQYRHLVTLFGPAERVRLLTGRIQSRS